MLIDFHTHTDASADGECSMQALAEAAHARGAFAVAVTDHCEIAELNGRWGEEGTRRSWQAYQALAAAQGTERDGFHLLFGIELGGANADFAAADALLGRYPFDFVIGSMHNLKGRRDFYYLDYAKEDANALFSQYLTQVEALIQWGNFDTLGHLTYPLRYITGENGIPIDWGYHMPQLRRLLGALARSGRALELNTAGQRKPYGALLRDDLVLREFARQGGEYVTIGSDSHTAQDVCAGIPEAMALLRECGFGRVTYYVARRPQQLPLL